jgi:hypothetical protein
VTTSGIRAHSNKEGHDKAGVDGKEEISSGDGVELENPRGVFPRANTSHG